MYRERLFFAHFFGNVINIVGAKFQRVLTLCCSIQAVKTAWDSLIFRYYSQIFLHCANCGFK